MKFQLRCLKCDKTYPQDRYVCKCENGCSSLLRTEYQQKNLEIDDRLPGIWKYIHWLPVTTVNKKLLKQSSTFKIYQSTKLAQHLGLKQLLICLNVYPWTKTGSFKDIEAEITFQRALDTKEKGTPLVLSSDGNNGISFTYYSQIVKYLIFLFVTEDARKKRIWSFTKRNPYLHLYPIEGDYYDAIHLANMFGRVKGVLPEGGASNVARRDGVGTIVLEATQQRKQIPDHFFQALGSGPGAIAAYEASLRLINDGHYGKKPIKIHGSQNFPYVPMYDAWKRKSRKIDETFQQESAKKLIDQTYAHVLTNRFPAYGIRGGVYDVLKKTSGEFYSVTNNEAKRAQLLFKRLEKCSIVPEAGITVSSLLQAVEQETIQKDDTILLNITGGGREEMKREKFKIAPSMHLIP